MLEPVYNVCHLAYEEVTGPKQNNNIKLDDQSSLGLVVVQPVTAPAKVLHKNKYIFTHETIKEYLAALYMLLSEDLDVSKIGEENQLEVRKFLCGLTRDMKIFKEAVDTKFVQNWKSYCIQCAHETQQQEACRYVMSKLVSEDKFECKHCVLSPSDCAAILKVLDPSQLQCLK